jgi:hypothetical protein
MKCQIVLASILLAGVSMVGCGCGNAPSKAEPILAGEHQLRKMAERTEVNSRISGGFFLFVGGISGTTQTAVNVKFAWKMNDGTYAISSLPLERIRVRIDENVAAPTIKFRWRPFGGEWTPQPQYLMDNYVSYALITAKESDWPVQVSLPLNQ